MSISDSILSLTHLASRHLSSGTVSGGRVLPKVVI